MLFIKYNQNKEMSRKKITHLNHIPNNFMRPGHSFDSKLAKKSYTQEIQANKTMHLEKLKLQISMHLTSKINNNESPQRSTTSQSQVLNSSANSSIRKIYRSRYNSKQNMYKQKREARQSRILAFHSKNQKASNQDLNELHKKSFLIKQIKPQKKQRFSDDQPICNPVFGRTFGSYYQIVAVQKKFYNSKYFLNENAPSFIGNKSQQLEKRYQSRINNPEATCNKIRYGNPQGTYLQPWRHHDDHHNHLESFY